ncbi:hypothetical protein BDF22DRAFT_667118 [Syncephalis plumigaleata]|nr:hypothetical protein BDF22DRAFT_667118 [Syncephalis plumigaleata]
MAIHQVKNFALILLLYLALFAHISVAINNAFKKSKLPINTYPLPNIKKLMLTAPFRLYEDVYQATGVYFIRNKGQFEDVHVICANKNTKSKLFDIYKKLKQVELLSYNPISRARIYVPVPLRKFGIRGGYCYIIPIKCRRTLQKHLARAASLPQSDLKAHAIMVFRRIHQDICVDDDSNVFLTKLEMSDKLKEVDDVPLASVVKLPIILQEALATNRKILDRVKASLYNQPYLFMDPPPLYSELPEGQTGHPPKYGSLSTS